jgi:23S rRNA pseudouridine1911/1915/1917 synthase
LREIASFDRYSNARSGAGEFSNLPKSIWHKRIAGLMRELFKIVFENDNLLVINKPAGLVCHPTKGDEYSSLISRVRIHLGDSSPSHMINRLDRETSGIVIVAKTDSFAKRLRGVWQARQVHKEYLAIVHGHPAKETATIDAPIGDDPKAIISIKGRVTYEGAPSLTEMRVLERFKREEGEFALVRATPRTGRKHQIRIHLAHVGHPIVGDKLYAGDEGRYLRFVQYAQTEEDKGALILENHALHAERLSFKVGDQDYSFSAPPEEWFCDFAGFTKGPKQ